MNKEQHTIEARKDQEYLEAIAARHAERQNTARMLRRRQTALEASSYAFNVVSVLTASYFVISLADEYPGILAWVMGAMLIGLLVLSEAAKRYAIVEGAEGVRAWFVVVFVLVAVSAYTSYHGGEKFTVEMAVKPPPEHNPAIDSLNARIAAVDADIATWRRQTWKGKIVTDARKGIARLEQTKVGLIEQRAELEGRDLERNDRLENNHETEIRQFGNVFGVVAGACDLLLIACLMIAKADEQNARRLIGLNANERERRANEQNERERTNERERERTPPNAKTAPGLAAMADAVPARVDLAQTEYAQRMARQLAEVREQMQKAQAEAARLRQEKERQEKEREQAEQRERDERERRANAERETANVRANAERISANERTNKITPPAWVAQAKAMRGAGKSYDEIAAELGKAKSTVHKWVNS